MISGNAAWAHILAKDQLLDSSACIGGEAIFITDDTIMEDSYSFLEPFLKARSMKASQMTFPATLAIIFVVFLHALSRLLRPLIQIKNPFPHPSVLYFIVCLYCFNRLKATLRLNYKPLYDPEESIANSLSYYKTIPLK